MMKIKMKKLTRALIFALAMAGSTAPVLAAETTPVTMPAASNVEIAQVRVPRLDTIVKAHCEGGTAVFRICNRGAKWPKMGLVQIIGPDGHKILVKRKMRFAKDQSATLKYKKAGRYPGGVSLYIDPVWDNLARSTTKHLRCS